MFGNYHKKTLKMQRKAIRLVEKREELEKCLFAEKTIRMEANKIKQLKKEIRSERKRAKAFRSVEISPIQNGGSEKDSQIARSAESSVFPNSNPKSKNAVKSGRAKQ